MLFNQEIEFNAQVVKYFKNNIPYITDYQKEKMQDVITNAPFSFYKRPKVKTSIFWRFTIFFFLIFFFLLIIFKPLKFLITGNSNWSRDKLKFFQKWAILCGFGD